MSKTVEKLPVDLALWKNAVLWVSETDKLANPSKSKKEFMLRVEEHYLWTVSDAKTPQDIKKIRQYYERQGYIPKVPLAKKRSGNVRNRRANGR